MLLRGTLADNFVEDLAQSVKAFIHMPVKFLLLRFASDEIFPAGLVGLGEILVTVLNDLSELIDLLGCL